MELLGGPPVVCRGRALDSAKLQPLVAGARALAAECFHPDCTAMLDAGSSDLWLLVARPQPVLLGYVLVREVRMRARNTDALVIDQLAIAPPLRRLGVGAELVEAVLQHAAGLGCELVALWSVVPALRFYRALGFQEVSAKALEVLREAGVSLFRGCVPLARAPPTEDREAFSVVSDSEPPTDEDTVMHHDPHEVASAAAPCGDEDSQHLHDASGLVRGRIQGVLSRPALNGLPCLITGYDPVRQRYSVHAEGAHERIALRRETVRLPVGTSVRIPEAPGHIAHMHAEIAEVLDNAGYRVAIASDSTEAETFLVHLSWDEVVVNFQPSR